MIRKIALIGLVLLILFSSQPVGKVLADPAGQIPFVKINNKYVTLYTVLTISSLPSTTFNVPQNNSPENYLINRPISFSIDKNLLPIKQNEINTIELSWDFGDGSSGTGWTQDHSYTKIGSYILSIHVRKASSFSSIDPSDPTLLDSILVNIVPDVNYRPPQAVIRVNNKAVGDPLVDSQQVDFRQKIQLDGSKSKVGSSAIVSYFWDFGDQTSDKQASIVHNFANSFSQIFPILRVTDANGFFSDTFAELDNLSLFDTSVPQITATIPKQVIVQKQNGVQNPVTNASLKLNDFLKRLTTDIFKSGKIDYRLLAILLFLAFFAGGLHAFTPGHGKTMMAAFLVGKGTKKVKDVLVIAFSTTFAHTITIYILGVILLVVNAKYAINNFIPYFNKLSAILIVLIAVNLIYSGLKNMIHIRNHNLNIEHGHDHHHHHEESKKGATTFELFIAGASGGIIPCIDALALLLLAASINQVLLGLLTVFIFSLGLASTIIAIGLLTVFGKNKLISGNKLETLAEAYGPIAAGIFILVIAIGLFLKV